ncbi:HAD hydrolase-like protein [Nocardioides speluncae]|uniref:HAD hydrolase-like protein n=1 Tax=Nocardioides speluncae TaxID=2670337 RepID=UPI001F0B7736|nr:HAD hydrolase-like protein [Nocardioides speluncae]
MTGLERAARPPLVVGFDLDLTLIETGPGFAATLKLVGDEIGFDFPIEEMASRIGLPLEQILAFHLPEDAVADAADRYRARYAEHGIAPTPALPGAHDALAAVRRHGGRSVLVTAKAAANARLHVEALGFDVDRVQGDMWGTGKADTLLAEGASVYVGDHVLDVEGARAAGATAVSVLTGGCTREQLVEAGTDVVLDSLTEFPGWLDEHVLDQRLAALEADLRSRGSVLVAFSGGADSAFVLAAAVRALGADRVAAATAYSPSLASTERDPARAFAEGLGVRVFTPETHEMDREGYRANDGDRCYFCKAELVETLLPLAARHGLAHIATGTNADDAVAGFRPGIRAADERGAITPLLDAGLTKEQIRAASRRWELPTWDKPAAACLASRVAYGVEVTPYRLARVERAEAAARAALAGAGLTSSDLRVRDLGERASVEVDAALLTDGLAEDTAAAGAVLEAVRAAGFPDAVLDSRGFRSGAMNELLDDPERYR